MDFKGTARPLNEMDLPRIAANAGIGEAELNAFMAVEAAGSGFDSEGRPKMLFEPHIFYRQLSGEKRHRALEEGLAYRRWGEQPYPTDSYPRLQRSMEIDSTAALKSASWGLGQILGTNHSMAGYDSVEEMVESFMEDEEAHLEAMVSYIVSTGIDDDLRAHRWETVARVYNGPGYAKHGYHTRLADAYIQAARSDGTGPRAGANDPSPSSYPTLRLGSKGFVVEHLQEVLNEREYSPGSVDGVFGSSTRRAVLDFQANNGLETDGIAGPATWESLVGSNSDNEKRPLSEERLAMDVKGLRAKGSRTVKAADAVQAGGALFAGVGSLAGITEALQEVQGASQAASAALGALVPVVEFVAANWWVLILPVGVAVIHFGGRIKASRLEDHREGRNMGR